MSVLATPGLNCQDSWDCQPPSPSIPSTSHCVTVTVAAWDTTGRDSLSVQRKWATEAQLSQAERMVKRSRKQEK